MTELEIITLLDFYGHLRSPFGERRGIANIGNLKLADQPVRDAIESFQSFHAVAMEPIIAAFYPQRLSAVVKVDGLVGPATEALLQTERCANPDYDMSLPEALVGGGNWKSCHNIGPFHCVVLRFKNEPPAHIASLFNSIWDRVIDSYAEIGLLIRRDDKAANFNIELSFVQPDGGWIGLAIVGQGETCSSQPIWCRYDKNYKPADLLSEWTTLIKHEIGHNCGLSHSSGGVMNPYIIKGLPVSWKGDSSLPLLKSRFGGEPIPRTPRQRELVMGWLYENNQFELIQKLPSSGGSVWPV